MATRSITAANAAFSIQVPGLFNVAVNLQQFSADDIFGTEPMKTGEVSMGVDGVLSAGFVFVPIPQSISLQANSPSCDVFDQINNAEQTLIDKYAINGIVLLPSLGKKWLLNNGYLTTYPPMPDAGRTLKPRKFEITWQQVLPAPNS